MVEVRITGLSRKLIGQFTKDPETIRALENIGLNADDIATAVSQIEASDVLLLAASPAFPDARFVASDGEIGLSDGGPGASYTFGLTDTGVSAGSYGGADKTVQVSINEKGRVSLAQEHDLVSDNVAEGSTNLYFTQARARTSLSDGNGITYDDTTGVISVTSAGTYGTPTGTLSRAAFATYTAPSISSPPTQAEVQAIADALQSVSRTLAALITDLKDNNNLS